jgi:folate-binding protein YgfZ
VFAEEVQVRDATDEFAAVAVVGPDAAAAIRTACGIVGADVLASIAQPGGVRTTIRGRQAIVLRISDTGEAGFELLVPPGDMSAVREALASAGAVELDEATAEAIRIESGIPRFHRDMDEETIPLEAGIESTAISFTKGCYVGQEVVVRVLHRGHGRVARRLVGLVFDAGGVVSPGAPVKVDGRDIGQVTSATWSPALDRTIALAYVHRELVNPGTSVEASGLAAHVAALPFVPLRAPVSE